MNAELSPTITLGDMELILIPAGEFTMGSTESAHEEVLEKPPHKVYLDAFYIGKYPVTNAQYKRFVDARGYRAPLLWSGDSVPEGKETHPVVWVNWADARAYCQWLAAETGWVVRLPTEAEWEKAARGTDGRRYPWGDKFDKHNANTDADDSGIGDTTPVGKYSPQGDSPYGVADMAGNVTEWTSSVYKPYPYNPDDGREDPYAPGERVTRGGTFDAYPGAVRSAYRPGQSPGFRNYHLGFRVLVSAGSPE